MSGVFVTAIGTDCGKTHVSAAILRELKDQGRPALALKPLMSGFSPEDLASSDAGRLLAAMGRAVNQQAVDEVCWKSFSEPLAPNVAARRAGVVLDYREMLRFLRRALAAHDGPALVEGAGGVMSPLTDTHTNLDLAADLDLPVLLLTTSYLGAVSHTLTAIDVLARRELPPKVIVVTEPSANANPAAVFAEELTRWTRIPVVTAPFARTATDSLPLAQDLVARLF